MERNGSAARHGTCSPSPPAAARGRVQSRPAGAATARRPGSSDERQQCEQREEAIDEIDRDASLLDASHVARQHFGPARNREVEAVPEVVLDTNDVARLA